MQIEEIFTLPEEKDDLLVVFAKTKVQKILERRRQRNRNIKFYLITRIRMVRDRNAVTNATGEEVEGSDESETTPHFRSKTMTVLADEDLEGSLNSCFQHMSTANEGSINRRSDWRLDHVLSIKVSFTPLGGSSDLSQLKRSKESEV